MLVVALIKPTVARTHTSACVLEHVLDQTANASAVPAPEEHVKTLQSNSKHSYALEKSNKTVT